MKSQSKKKNKFPDSEPRRYTREMVAEACLRMGASENATEKYLADFPEKGAPSVTSITKYCDDKSGVLKGWAMKEMGKAMEEHMGAPITEDLIKYCKAAPGRVSDEAKDYGTLAHEALELIVEGKALKPEHSKVLVTSTSAIRWREEAMPKPRLTEFAVYSRTYGYAGRADFVGELYGEEAINDYKSSKAIYPEYEVQGWAYLRAYNEMVEHLGIKNPLATHVYITRLPKTEPDGGGESPFEVMRVIVDLFPVFRAAQTIFNFNN